METQLIAIQTSNSFVLNQRRMENLDVNFLMITSLIIFSTICILIYACLPKNSKYSLGFNQSHPFPCYRCQYFSNNLHLRCTVHPVTALTEQAVDCRDFYPHG
jgi:hypothetical protein